MLPHPAVVTLLTTPSLLNDAAGHLIGDQEELREHVPGSVSAAGTLVSP